MNPGFLPVAKTFEKWHLDEMVREPSCPELRPVPRLKPRRNKKPERQSDLESSDLGLVAHTGI